MDNAEAKYSDIRDGDSRQVASEPERLKDVAVATEKLSQQLGVIADSANFFSYSRLKDAQARVSLLDTSDILSRATETARVNPEAYATEYGSFAGALAGLERTVEQLSKHLGQSSTEIDPGTANAAARLLADRLVDLAEAANALDTRSTQMLAQESARESVKEFSQELAAARDKVAAAASEFGVDARKLEWGIYADRESKQADLWRWATVLSLAATTTFAFIVFLRHVSVGGSWQELVLKLATAISLASLAGYAARQARSHRVESRAARREALDFAAIRLFVSDLTPESRDEVLRQFGMTRFTTQLPVTAASGEGETGYDPTALLERLATIVSKSGR